MSALPAPSRGAPVKDRHYYCCHARRRQPRQSGLKEPHAALGVFNTASLGMEETVTEIEKLQGEIDDTLREMAALNRMILPQRTTEEIRAIRQHSQWCLRELMKLHDKLDKFSEGKVGVDRGTDLIIRAPFGGPFSLRP